MPEKEEGFEFWDFALYLEQQHQNKNHVTIQYHNYPEDSSDEQAIRRWIAPQIKPLAAYMRELADIFNRPYKTLPVECYTVAVIDDMFRDGTFARIANTFEQTNSPAYNPYTIRIEPIPTTIKLARPQWWQEPIYYQIEKDLNEQLAYRIQLGITDPKELL